MGSGTLAAGEEVGGEVVKFAGLETEGFGEEADLDLGGGIALLAEETEESAPVKGGDVADDGESKNKNKNKNVGAKPQDPLGLDKLGYTKEQVDGWLAQGYSVADIKNGVAASGEKNTEVTNKLSSEIAAA